MSRVHNTSIRTNIENSVYRISSIYRNWGIIACPDLCGWETIVWKQDDESQWNIFCHIPTNYDAEHVVQMHQHIVNLYKQNGNLDELIKEEE